MWPTEEIPNQDTIYRWVKNTFIVDGTVGTGAFQNTTGTNGMSVNWGRYSDCLDTRDDLASAGKNPNEYGVVEIRVADIRTKIEPSQDVMHAPIAENHAHAEVIGDKKKRSTRAMIVGIATICVLPEIESDGHTQ